jgi:hypothetical protein
VSAITTRTSRSPAIFSEELLDVELAVATAALRTARRTLALPFAFFVGAFALFAAFGLGRVTLRVGVAAGGVTTTGVYVLTGD